MTIVRPPAPRIGIKDIARATGVSIGTVDRALHDKPGINAKTRARVLSAAATLGYRPNLAARHLKSGTTVRIAVHLPKEIALFWDSLREGICEAAAPFEPALHVEFRSYPRLGEGDVELFEDALESGANGIIVAPGDPGALRPSIRKAFSLGVAVACVVTDAPDTGRLTSVSADPFTVGAVAGELLARFLPSGGATAFFTGWLGTQDHADKLRGFESSLAAFGKSLSLASVVEAHDDEQAAHRQATALLKEHPHVQGVYVSTVNSLPVLRALEEQGRLGSVTLVTTDLFPDLRPWLRSGAVAATLYQRPLTQGRLALQALFRFLSEGTAPPPRLKVMPHVVMRSNLDLVLERLGADL
ncbi:MAG: LacI family DNA-binding transcriptional regulator [Acidobacteria bacterium]|nr:MAG: LacI family DNA-binding transcriptional regulator [Acidobacteriota bacterium]